MIRKASAFAVITLLALAGSASASTLPLPLAKQLAKRLAEQQVKARGVVLYHILDPRRESATRIRFTYDDRSAAHVYCTAQVVIAFEPPAGRRIVGRFRNRRCAGIPSDALAIESAAQAAFGAVTARVDAVRSAAAAYARALKPCADLKPPVAARKDVKLLVGAGELEAIEAPVDPTLAAFVVSIGAVPTTDKTLTAAVAAWGDYLTAVRALPRIGDACSLLRPWSTKAFAPADAPVDLAALRALDARTTADAKAIAQAARLLAAEGVFPRAVIAFTPAGLLLQLAPSGGISGP